MQAVIAAFHFDDAVAAGGGARQAHGVHGAFRAAIAEAHHLHRESACRFPPPVPIPDRAACRTSCRCRAFACTAFTHRRMAVPRHQRAEAKIEIEVFVAVNIVDVSAFAVANEKRIGIVGAIIAGDAQWQAAFALWCAPSFERGVRFSYVLISCSQSFVHNFLQMLVLWPTHGPEIYSRLP